MGVCSETGSDNIPLRFRAEASLWPPLQCGRRCTLESMKSTRRIKSAAPLDVHVEPELRREVEAVLDAGESLSEFVATCLRSRISWRRTQDAFLRRSQDAVARALRDGTGISCQEMLERMDARLDEAHRRLATVVRPPKQS